jgi:hypothetical protein
MLNDLPFLNRRAAGVSTRKFKKAKQEGVQPFLALLFLPA